MRKIELTQGEFATVDDDLFDYLNSFNWYTRKDHRTAYASTTRRFLGKANTIRMHHMIVGSPLRGKGLMIDHINGNGLDNRKENLRIVNYRGNALNRIDQKGRFPGTIFNPKTKKWQAKIKVNGHNKHLGYFDTAKMAFSAYLRELKKSDRENYDQYMAFTKLKEELRK